MKIEINLYTEDAAKERILPELRPRIWVKVEITDEELHTLGKNHKELMEAIARLINFSIQHME